MDFPVENQKFILQGIGSPAAERLDWELPVETLIEETSGQLLHRGHFQRMSGASIASDMAQLLVRGIDSDLVRELKLRAARHGNSAEEEHRRILREALKPRHAPRTLKDLLLDIPDVGEDSDFERPLDRGRAVDI